MKKYDIDKCFGCAAKFTIPLNKIIAPLARWGTKNMYKCLMNRKDMTFQTVRIQAGQGEIDVHIISPCQIKSENPCLFYIHGGGFVYDAAPHHYKNAAQYALETGSIVVFPRYRLTPKVAYPVPIEDCQYAYEWMLKNAASYHIDKAKIGIGGDSAGGFLAAKLTNWALENRYEVLYQLLVYPVIDHTMRTESMAKYVDTPMWNSKLNQIMWEWYYKGHPEKEPSLLDISLPYPMPPTYIETAEFDCLHDEGVLYYKKLCELGTTIRLREPKRTIHGFDGVDCEITRAAMKARIAFIKEMK